MAVLLHLSDLHLGSGEHDTGDYKSGGVPQSERQTRRSYYEATLRAVAQRMEHKGQVLDSVVVSGDVTDRGDPDGLTRLPDLLSQLGDVWPGPERTVVVPGNHDVPRGTAPSTPERYDAFVKAIRDNGFVTPYLDGVDVDGDGQVDSGYGEPTLQAMDGSFVIVAMNSANYCQYTQPLTDSLTEQDVQATRAQGGLAAAVAAELDLFRAVDVARVSPGQMVALRRALADRAPAPDGPVRILTLHHHLIPVSPEEEFRAFESIINLGHLLEFIDANAIDLVLHGHKHAGSLPGEAGLPAVTGRTGRVIRVSAAGTVWGQGSDRAEIARLVDVEGGAIPTVSIHAIGAVSAGSGLASDGMTAMETFEPGVPTRSAAVGDGIHVIEGHTTDVVYARLTRFFSTLDERTEVNHLTCRVETPDGADRPPTGFPPPQTSDADTWFDDMVEWWQQHDPGLILPHTGKPRPPYFNHGERLYRWNGTTNQLDGVVDALRTEPRTTRAWVTLVDVIGDEIGNTKKDYPSFVAAQFLITDNRLTVVAYFRKQQMRVWWPVNMAELARMQSKVARQVGDPSGVGPVEVGSIVTIAGRAVWGGPKPRVIVPWVDRQYEEQSRDLWSLALRLLSPSGDDGNLVADWRRVFEDWEPGEEYNSDGVPIAITGLTIMTEAVAVIAGHFGSASGQRLADELRTLTQTNIAFAEAEALPDRKAADREVRYKQWREQVGLRVGAIEKIVRESAGRPSEEV